MAKEQKFIEKPEKIAPIIMILILLISLTIIFSIAVRQWSMTFSKQGFEDTELNTDCAGALYIEQLEYNSPYIKARITNIRKNMTLSNLRLITKYFNRTIKKEYQLGGYGVTDPLGPRQSSGFLINVGSEAPTSVDIYASPCPSPFTAGTI